MSTTVDIAVRQARRDDAAALAQLAGVLGYPTTHLDIIARLERLHDADDLVLVAGPVGETIVGWVHGVVRCTLESGRYAEIVGLVVDPTHRRCGVGRLLVRAVERWAATQGLRRLRVRTRLARGDAHRFYEAAGFTAVKLQTVFERELTSDTT